MFERDFGMGKKLIQNSFYYFPTQNFANMAPKISSVTFVPMMLERFLSDCLKSKARNSGEISFLKP